MVKVDRTYLKFDARIENDLQEKKVPLETLAHMTTTQRYFVLRRNGFSKADCGIVEMYLCEFGNQFLPATNCRDETERNRVMDEAQALIDLAAEEGEEDDTKEGASSLHRYVSSAIIEESAAKSDDEEMLALEDKSYNKKTTAKKVGPDTADNYVGLVNSGSTCYLNSTVQVLFHIPLFRKLIYSIDVANIEGSDAARAIPTALQSLFFSMQRKETGVRTSQLTEAFGWSSGELSVQHDVHEMIGKLLEGLEVITTGTHIDQQVKGSFFGEMLRFVNCVDVRHVSPNYTPFLDLELIVKDCATLYDSLTELTKIDRLDGNYAWEHEDGTTTRHPADVGSIISRAPPVLIIHPSRLAFCMQRFESVTVENPWTFPANLNISRFCRGSPDDVDDVSVANPDGPEKDCDYPAFDYALNSVVIHVGSAHAGHYYCYQKIGDEWLQFNDTVVRTVSESDVFSDAFAEPSWYTDYWGTQQARTATHRATLLTYIRKADMDRIVFPVEDSSLPTFLVENMVAYEQKRKEVEEEKTRKARLITMRILVEDLGGAFLEPISEAEHKNNMPRVEVDKAASYEEIEAAIIKVLGIPQSSIQDLWMYDSKGITYRSPYYAAYNLRTKLPSSWYLEKGTVFVQLHPSHHRPRSGNGKRERDEDDNDLRRADTEPFVAAIAADDKDDGTVVPTTSSQAAEDEDSASQLNVLNDKPAVNLDVYHLCFLQSAEHSIQYVSTVNSIADIEAYLKTQEPLVIAELEALAAAKEAHETKEKIPAAATSQVAEDSETPTETDDSSSMAPLQPSSDTAMGTPSISVGDSSLNLYKDPSTPLTEDLTSCLTHTTNVENKAVIAEKSPVPSTRTALWNYFSNMKKSLTQLTSLSLYSGEIIVVAPSYVTLKDANRAHDRISNALTVTVSQLDDVEEGEELFDVTLYPRMSYPEIQQVIYDALTDPTVRCENPLRVMPKSPAHIGLRTHDLDSDLPHMNMCTSFKYRSSYSSTPQDAEGILTSRNILIRKVYMSVLPHTLSELEANYFKEIPVRISHFFCRYVYIPTTYAFLQNSTICDALFMVYEQLEPFMSEELATSIKKRLDDNLIRFTDGLEQLDVVFRLVRLKYNSNEISHCYMDWGTALHRYFNNSSLDKFTLDLLPVDKHEGVLPVTAHKNLKEMKVKCETDEERNNLTLPPQWMDAFHIDRRSGRGEVHGYPFSVVLRDMDHKTGKTLLQEVIGQLGIHPDEETTLPSSSGTGEAETASAASTAAATPTSAVPPTGSPTSSTFPDVSVFADAMKNWRLVFNGTVGVKVLDREIKYGDIADSVGVLISVMLDHPQVSRGVQKGAGRNMRVQQSIKINVISDQVKPISATMTTTGSASSLQKAFET